MKSYRYGVWWVDDEVTQGETESNTGSLNGYTARSAHISTRSRWSGVDRLQRIRRLVADRRSHCCRHFQITAIRYLINNCWFSHDESDNFDNNKKNARF